MTRVVVTRVVRGIVTDPNIDYHAKHIHEAIVDGVAKGRTFLFIQETAEGHAIYWTRPKTMWRKEPPTADEVKAHAWWWNKPASGNPPHILHLDVEETDGVSVIVEVDGGETTYPFDPNGWPGEWAPAVPPP